MSNFITSLILCLCVQIMAVTSDFKIHVYTNPSININYLSNVNGNPVTANIDSETRLTACPLSNGSVLVAYQEIGQAPKWVEEIVIGYIPKVVAMFVDGFRVLLACETQEGVLFVLNFEVTAKSIGRVTAVDTQGVDPHVYINRNHECIVVYKDTVSHKVAGVVFPFGGELPTLEGKPLSDAPFSSIKLETSFIANEGIATFLDPGSFQIQVARFHFSQKAGILPQKTLSTQFISNSSVKCCIDVNQRSFIQFLNTSSQLTGRCISADNQLDSDSILISDMNSTINNNSQLTLYFGIVTSIWRDDTEGGVFTRFIDINSRNPYLSPISCFSLGGMKPNIVAFGSETVAACLNGNVLLVGCAKWSYPISAPAWDVTHVDLPASTNTDVLGMSFLTNGQVVCNIPSLSELLVVDFFPLDPIRRLLEYQRRFVPFKSQKGA